MDVAKAIAEITTLHVMLPIKSRPFAVILSRQGENDNILHPLEKMAELFHRSIDYLFGHATA